jgi:hypothetical protein
VFKARGTNFILGIGFISLLLGLLFTLAIPEDLVPFLSIFLPDHTLEIISTNQNVAEISWIKTSIPSFSYQQAKKIIGWERINNSLVTDGSDTSIFEWEGKVGNNATIYFISSPNSGNVTIKWDGIPEEINLSTSTEGEINYHRDFYVHPLNKLTAYFLILCSLSIIFFIILVYTNEYSKTPKNQKNIPKKKYLLLFMIPPITVWGVYLVTFWPAVMSVDSVVQWQEIISGKISNMIPAFHTMILWLITRIWEYPAIICIFQILALSLVLAWGLWSLIYYGVPKWIAWLNCLFFAVSPINSVMANTIWKDILYSTALFALYVIMIHIVFSQGKWLTRKWNLLILILASIGVSLFRHNGFPIPFLMIILLALLYKNYRKPLINVGLILSAIIIIITGILFPLAKVINVPELGPRMFLHHIAAQVDANTRLIPEEKTFLDTLLPFNEWEYHCCTIVPIIYKENFNNKYLRENTMQVMQLYLKLTFRNPGVELQHLLCSASPIWSLQPFCYWPGTDFAVNQPGNWIVPNELNLNENSLLPSLVNPLYEIVLKFEELELLRNPAFYLYISILASLIIMLRFNSRKLLILAFLPILQSAIMFFLSVSVSLRFQYSVYLIGLFSLILFFLPNNKNMMGAPPKSDN